MMENREFQIFADIMWTHRMEVARFLGVSYEYYINTNNNLKLLDVVNAGSSGEGVGKEVIAYDRPSGDSKELRIAIDLENPDKDLTIEGANEFGVLDLTGEAESSPTSEGETAKVVPRMMMQKGKEEKKSTMDTGNNTTDTVFKDTSKSGLLDSVVYMLENTNKGLFEIISDPYPAAVVLSELTEKPKARATSQGFYYYSEYDKRCYTFEKNSREMKYPKGVKEDPTSFCRRCFAEVHRDKCDEKVINTNHRRQFNIAKSLFGKLFIDITDNLKDHRIICKNCEVPIFKLIDQKLVICFFCDRILKEGSE
eukprot:TRINITY_DN299_c0_g1_i3.p1 TRINITY_DN299_c0_g1~~TRINITY_DN299_c0_g1_i3.p1  ORF type:complete len:310 (-),score=52.38 TRINITY_DN299_c0_g1_i3:130-1059(-)